MYGGKAEIPRLNRAVPVPFKIEQETDDSRALSDAYNSWMKERFSLELD